jgi:hypothetical protein
MIRRTSFAAALSAVVLAACGSVTDTVAFNVPPQYHSKASFGPFMQLWQTPDEKSVMMLMAIPGEMDMNKALANAQIKDAKFKKKERITICGNQPADLAQIVGTTGTTVKVGFGAGETTKSNSNIEMLSTVANGKTYFAMYAWPLKATADPQAEAALRGICSK